MFNENTRCKRRNGKGMLLGVDIFFFFEIGTTALRGYSNFHGRNVVSIKTEIQRLYALVKSKPVIYY
jgi:hypothetical protein